MKTLKTLVLQYAVSSLLILSSLALCGCKCSAPRPINAKVILDNAPATQCDLVVLAATGHQKIKIEVTDHRQFTRTYDFVNSPNLTYDVEVPSIGPFEFDVKVQEVDSLTCPPCAGKCPNGSNGSPQWHDIERVQLGGTAGQMYRLQVPHVGCAC